MEVMSLSRGQQLALEERVEEVLNIQLGIYYSTQADIQHIYIYI